MNERIRKQEENENNSSLSNSMAGHYKTHGSVSESNAKQDLGASLLSSQMQLSELNTQMIGYSKLDHSRKMSAAYNSADDVERDLSDLPQARSQMMVSYENQQENFYRPPNVYR